MVSFFFFTWINLTPIDHKLKAKQDGVKDKSHTWSRTAAGTTKRGGTGVLIGLT